LPPMVAALVFAWSATASWIAMQFAAAPAPIVQPFGLERFLWPAGLLLTLDLARGGGSFLRVLLMLSLGPFAQGLPAALFSKLASDHGWGTGLDVENVVKIVNPATRLQFQPRLLPNSSEQQFWLIWAEHVFVYPGLYLLGFTGIAFASFMIQKHDRMAERARNSPSSVRMGRLESGRLVVVPGALEQQHGRVEAHRRLGEQRRALEELDLARRRREQALEQTADLQRQRGRELLARREPLH